MSEFVVQKHVKVDASKAVVWEALTNPDLTEKYFYGCRIQSNFAPGDPITFKRRILWLFPFELKGTVLTADPNDLLTYSLKNSKSTSQSIVSISLHEEEDGRTLVSITDDVGQGEGAEQRYNRSVRGWNKILKGLKRVAEEKTYDASQS